MSAPSTSLATGIVLAVQWAPAAAAVFPKIASAFRIPTRLPSERGVLLTFDDGPHVEGTPAVLEALVQSGASAVFFVSGEQVHKHPGLVQEIVAAGHELGIHGYRHQTRREWTRRLAADDAERGLEAVFAASGIVPRLYRPPRGVFTLSGLRVVRSLGLEPLLWSRWGRDWERRASVGSIVQRASRRLEPGDVVLLHDADHYSACGSWRRTAAAVPEIVKKIAAADLTPTSVHRREGRLALAI